MAYDIGPRIGIEGEKEYRDAINKINSNMKTLGTEMGAVMSQFEKGDKSMGALTAQNKVLNKQIEEQKQKLSELQKGLAAASQKYGENDKVTQGWQQSVNKATADLNNMERQLNQNSTAIKEYGETQIQAAKNSEEFKTAQEKLKSAFNVVKIAALAVGASIAAFSMQAMEGADELQALADKTGLSAERLQELKYAGSNLGVELTTITGAQTKLTKAMYSAQAGSKNQSQAFKDLGISIVDSNGQLRNAKVVMSEAFDALGKVGNETQRDALAMQLFGKSAVELNPLIKAGGDELNRLAKEARDSGAVMSNEAVEGLDSFGDAIENMKSSLVGKFGEAFSNLAPMLTEFTDKVKSLDMTPLVNGLKWIIDNSSVIAAAAVGISVAMAGWNIMTTVSAIVQGIKQWKLATESLTIAQKALNLAQGASPVGIIITLVAALAAALVILWHTNDGFREAVTNAWEQIKQTAQIVWTAVAEFFTVKIPAAFGVVLDFVKNNWPSLLLLLVNPFAGAIKLLYDLNPQFKAWVDGLLLKFQEWIGGFTDIGKNMVRGIWDGIKSMASWLWNKVSGFVGGIVDGVKDVLGIHSPSRVFAGIGQYMAQGLGQGFTDAMQEVSRQVNGSMAFTAPAASSPGTNAQTAPANIAKITVLLDGKVIGEAVTPVVSQKLYTAVTQSSRGRGVALAPQF